MAHPQKHDFGLIDHDAKLRHSLLGAFQIQVLCLVGIGSIVSLITSGHGPFDQRSIVPPIVLIAGNIVQYFLWRKRKDTVVAYAVVGSLFLVMAVGTLFNGLLAPAVFVPLLTIIGAGYLLGSRTAWLMGVASLAFLLFAYIGHKLGVIHAQTPPAAIWARIVGVQLVASAFSLAIPLRGLLSGVRLIDQEKSALERSLIELEGRRAILSREVDQRTHELEQANADLAAFSYSLSHDLETPLRSIQGFAQTLESNPNLTQRQKMLLAKISLGSSELETDIRRILQNSRGESES